MSVFNDYITVATTASTEIVEKKSRFIGHVAPVKTQEAALAFIELKKKEFKDASHNVFAFSIRENNLKRFSDDGEPQGTAGKPILSILENEAIIDCAIVVTRYFGGTLLGTGGLVRAYSLAAKEVLKVASIIKMTLSQNLCVVLPYSLYDIFQTKLDKYCLRVTDTQFTHEVEINLTIANCELDQFVQEITQMSNSNAQIIKKEKVFSFF